MLTWLSAVDQDAPMVASRLLQGIGQLRHPVESSVVVDSLGQFNHGGRQPRRLDGEGLEGVAEDVTDQPCLRQKLGSLGAEKGILGNAGLCASGSISGSDGGVGGGSIPSGLTSCPLTGKPSGTQLLWTGTSICKTLCYLDRRTTEGVDPLPETPRTSDSEQSELPLAHRPAVLEEFEHCLRLGAILPFAVRHFACLDEALAEAGHDTAFPWSIQVEQADKM